MQFYMINIGIHLISFMCCFYALSCVRFDKFCDVRNPVKVQLLLLVMALGLGYVVAQFLLTLTIFNGL